MAETTGIEWADRTFSPWEGCQKVGPGCDHCYAEARNDRFKGGNWGPGAPRRVMSDAYWRNPWRWNEELGRAGRRESVFPSLCDPFDNAAPAGQRERFANLILGTPNLEWLLLTKRIGNVVTMLSEMFPDGAPPNIRIGATIVNQAEWDRDHPKICAAYIATGRKVFLSLEPLLGPVVLSSIRYNIATAIGWIIAGGESGGQGRPMKPDWIASLRDQAAALRCPFMFKQWGDWAPAKDVPDEHEDAVERAYFGCFVGDQWSGACSDEWAREHPPVIVKLGKKRAGRMLDGREHSEFPVNHTGKD